jgi:mRNA-degrading endonuclease toxin of MazEF toxin-antitoxin module
VVARGEVWWYEHPEAGRRPYLVLTRTEAIGVMSQIIGVPATRVVREIPTEVAIDESDGMPAECVLSLDNLSVIRKSLLTDRITTLGIDKMLLVCEALQRATAC